MQQAAASGGIDGESCSAPHPASAVRAVVGWAMTSLTRLVRRCAGGSSAALDCLSWWLGASSWWRWLSCAAAGRLTVNRLDCMLLMLQLLMPLNMAV